MQHKGSQIYTSIKAQYLYFVKFSALSFHSTIKLTCLITRCLWAIDTN